ncbi:hypothetical protein PC122_g9172 [Phytophthora cactorum]|nr:hypothetical protein PC122_g9172 [Phytophthora cactorum]
MFGTPYRIAGFLGASVSSSASSLQDATEAIAWAIRPEEYSVNDSRIFDNFHAKDSDSYAIDNHLCPCIDDCHTDIDHFDSKGTDDGTTTDGFKHHLKRIRYNIFGPRQPKLVRIDIFANDYNTARNDIIAVNRYGRSKCSGELHEQHE